MKLHTNIIFPFFTLACHDISLACFEPALNGGICVPLPGALTIRPPDRVSCMDGKIHN